ncbi:hypothetical protein ACTD31_004355, partial [Shigella flexneri]
SSNSGFFIGISSPSAAHAIAKAYRYGTFPCPCWHNNIYQLLFNPTPQMHFFINLICNKTTSHIEIFAKIVHEKSFSLPIRDINNHQYHNYSTAINLFPPLRTSDNGLKSLRPLATTLLNEESLA